MKIDVDHRSNRVTVHAAGRFDAAGAAALEERVAPLLSGQRPVPVMLDLSRVVGVAAGGTGVLRSLYRRAEAQRDRLMPGGPRLLRLAHLSRPMLDALRADGLLDELNVSYGSAPHARPAEERSYRALLPRVRDLFPAPLSDAERDAAFVRTVAMGLERVDALKTQRPYLGERKMLDYDAARRAALPERVSTLDEVIPAVADYLQGLVIWGHPRAQENVIPPTTTAAVVGQVFGAMYNPNVIWDEYSHRVSQAEVEAAAICASLVGYSADRSAGVFTFGGTGTILYGVKLGLEKAQPGALRTGVGGALKLVASAASHYAKLSVAGWLGIGSDNVVAVPTDPDNAMSRRALETALREILDRGQRIAGIIATMGTTDAFAIDNLEEIVHLRDALAAEYRLPYRPHVHADAVIGWAWAVFNDYDFLANPLGFPPRTIRSLWDVRSNMQALHLADSVGIDFHKTGYAPYVSSLFLCRDRADLDRLSRDAAQMPYLFQFGNYHPGVFTLEASRSGGSILAALANLKLIGKEGYRVLLGHAVTMAEALRARLEHAPHAVVVNDFNHGMVTLFRVYPDGVDAATAYHEEIADPARADQLEGHNQYNRRVFQALHHQLEQGDGVALSITDQYRTTAYGAPIPALKSFVMSPFVDEAAMEHVVACVERARAAVAGQ
jgi:glutamate/tyrosine decarboxylase-like PLP-dependent enzyme